MNPLCIGRYRLSEMLSAGARCPARWRSTGCGSKPLAKTFPEAKERRRKWFPVAEAAGLVAEPELATIIAQFIPPCRAGPIAADDDDDPDTQGARSLRQGH
jgi:hypothetical protein